MKRGIVGAPAVPMMSLLATVTKSGRLSGLGIGLTTSDHFNRQNGAAKHVDDRSGLHAPEHIHTASGEIRREIDLERPRDADERHRHHPRQK